MNDEDINEIALNFHRSGNLNDGGNEEEHHSDIDPELEAMPLEEIMKEARKRLFVFLTNAVCKGMATPQEMAVLRALLKDNGMVMGDVSDGAGEQSNPKKADRPLDLPVFQNAPYDLQ